MLFPIGRNAFAANVPKIGKDVKKIMAVNPNFGKGVGYIA